MSEKDIYIKLLGFTPTFLNKAHQKRSIACLESLKKQSQHCISLNDAKEQIRRNEEMLMTHSRYKSMR